MRRVFRMIGLAVLMAGGAAGSALAQGDERLHSCETSLQGVRTEINYVQDEAYFANVGRIEHRFSRFGKVSCPGYVTLREILRRSGMEDDGRYCVLWDRQGDTYVGAQIGHRKANAVCGAAFCERVNAAKAATLQGGKAATTAGFEAVQQRPGAALLSAVTGDMVGKIEGAGAVASGLASSPVGVGAVLVGAAATGGALWYCAEGPEANSIADEPMPEPEAYVPRAEDFPQGTMLPSGAGQDDVVWSSTLPPAAEGAAPTVAPGKDAPAEPVVEAPRAP